MPHKDRGERLRYMREYHHRNKDIKNPRRIRYHLKDRLMCLRLAGMEIKCARCGFAQHTAALQVHHRDPKQKAFGIDQALRRLRGEYSIEQVVTELEKCDLICSNCHAIEHAKYGKAEIDDVLAELRTEGVV